MSIGMDKTEITAWLREADAARLEALWHATDETRQRCVGDEVHLRGLIEFSNYCVRHCHYCGGYSGYAGSASPAQDQSAPNAEKMRPCGLMGGVESSEPAP